MEAGCYTLSSQLISIVLLSTCFNMLNRAFSGSGLILWSKTRQEWIGNRTPQKQTAAQESKLRWASSRFRILKTINLMRRFDSCWFQSIYFPYKCVYIHLMSVFFYHHKLQLWCELRNFAGDQQAFSSVNPSIGESCWTISMIFGL